MYHNKRKRSTSPSNRHGHGSRGPTIAVRALGLRRGLAELGEPSRYQIEETLPQLAADLAGSSDIILSNAVFPMIKAVIKEQPHKTSLIAALLECTDAITPGILQSTLMLAHEEISDALNNGCYHALVQWIRLVAALQSVDHTAFAVLLQDLMDRAIALSDDPRGAELYTAVVHGVVYFARSSGLPVSPELTAKLQEFDSGDLSKSQLAETVYGPNAPFSAEPIIKQLERAVKSSIDTNDWDVSFLLDVGKFTHLVSKDANKPILDTSEVKTPSGEENPELSIPGMEQDTADIPAETKPKPRFLAVHVPLAEELPQWKLPVNRQASYRDGFRDMRMLIYSDGEFETTPRCDTLFGSVIRQLAKEVISNMEFNRKEVMRQLISFDLFFDSKKFAAPGIHMDALASIPKGESTLKVEDLALEVVLEQMLALPVSEYPPVYYGSVLIEACIVAPQSIAPVLGRSVRFFFGNCESLDAEVFWRVISWFAHHASNFNFTWKWREWQEYLSLPKFHPKMVFMQELINKQVRLIYPERLRNDKVIPPEFQKLIPNCPEVPKFVYASDDLVMTLANAMADADEADITSQIIQIQEQCVSNAIGKPADELDESLSDILIQSLLEAGNISPTHAASAISRHLSQIQGKINNEIHYVRSTFAYWSESPWNAVLILRQFVKAGVLTPKTILEYVIDRRDLLVSSLGWEILTSYWTDLEPLLVKLETDEDVDKDSVEPNDEWTSWWNQRLHRALKRFITINSGIRELKEEADKELDVFESAEPAVIIEAESNPEGEKMEIVAEPLATESKEEHSKPEEPVKSEEPTSSEAHMASVDSNSVEQDQPDNMEINSEPAIEGNQQLTEE